MRTWTEFCTDILWLSHVKVTKPLGNRLKVKRPKSQASTSGSESSEMFFFFTILVNKCFFSFPIQIIVKTKNNFIIMTKICMIKFFEKCSYVSAGHVRVITMPQCCTFADCTGLLKVNYVFCTCVVVGFTVPWLGTVCVMIVVVFPDVVSWMRGYGAGQLLWMDKHSYRNTIEMDLLMQKHVWMVKWLKQRCF